MYILISVLFCISGLMADKLGSYEFAFYAAGSLMLLSAAVQFLMLCVKPSVKADQTRRELVSMEADPESTSENNQDRDHKEYLSRLYVDSTLRKNEKSASVESMLFL